LTDLGTAATRGRPPRERTREEHVKALVVFDSVAGNTKKIAEAIASGIAGETRAVSVGSAEAKDLGNVSLLVVGSPTYGGRPTEAMQAFIASLEKAPDLFVAAFDTRLRMKFVRLFGFAADKIADRFRRIGSTVEDEPAGFIVNGRAGPLADGELERARAWGQELSKKHAGLR